ncbi:MAG: gliding motility-associated C-terminal domain-containing protein [Chitinophagaceae bacterium]|nr:gliding motility-associated C-terminal domain-containing protein [Chitinophagaceae bacterium]
MPSTLLFARRNCPYSWNGNSYNAGGSYNITLTNAAGCDSIATLLLTVKANSSSSTDVSICAAQLPYRWNSNNYNTAGSYTVTLINSAGCDSIATLVLTVKASSVSTTNLSVCTNQLPYNWNGNGYTAAGTYHVTLTNAAGCDSLATMILAVKESPIVSLGSDTSLCPGDAITLSPGSYDHYLWQDLSIAQTYKAVRTGTYSVTVSNTNGCEGTASINVQYLPDCGDIFFPTAISPGDANNINDKFGAMGNLLGVSNYSLSIYNRYGELVFSTTDPYKKWDGIYKNKAFGNVNFVWYSSYLLNSQKHRVQKGNLVVIR